MKCLETKFKFIILTIWYKNLNYSEIIHYILI